MSVFFPVATVLRTSVSRFKQLSLCSLQEQEEIPSSGSHRSENLGASQEEGP